MGRPSCGACGRPLATSLSPGDPRPRPTPRLPRRQGETLSACCKTLQSIAVLGTQPQAVGTGIHVMF